MHTPPPTRTHTHTQGDTHTHPHPATHSSKFFPSVQVASNTKQQPGVELGFTGDLFQPAPWTPTTRKGMPAEFEKYHDDPSYVFINVPPNFMFNAKIYKPSRLCAIYKVVESSRDD
jgi:hypothetical protein